MTAAADFLSIPDTSVPHPGMAGSRVRHAGGAMRMCLPVALMLAGICPMAHGKEPPRDAAKSRLATEGGATFLVRVQPADGRKANTDSMARAATIIEKRLNPAGSKDIAVTPQGTDCLYVEVPGMKE